MAFKIHECFLLPGLIYCNKNCGDRNNDNKLSRKYKVCDYDR